MPAYTILLVTRVSNIYREICSNLPWIYQNIFHFCVFLPPSPPPSPLLTVFLVSMSNRCTPSLKHCKKNIVKIENKRTSEPRLLRHCPPPPPRSHPTRPPGLQSCLDATFNMVYEQLRQKAFCRGAGRRVANTPSRSSASGGGVSNDTPDSTVVGAAPTPPVAEEAGGGGPGGGRAAASPDNPVYMLFQFVFLNMATEVFFFFWGSYNMILIFLY